MPTGYAELRTKSKKSLQEVADEISASKAHLWDLERGRALNPSIELLKSLSRCYQVSVADLIGENPHAEQQPSDLFAMYRDLQELSAVRPAGDSIDDVAFPQTPGTRHMNILRMDLDGANRPAALISAILKHEPTLAAPIPVEELALQLDIVEIKDLEIDGFEGGLVTDKSRSEGSFS